jgi:hypothetical protein
MDTEQPMNGWEKLKVLGSLVTAIGVPVTVAFIGSLYTTAIKESETRVKFVELAISILKSEPTTETGSLRSWAVETINKNSEVKLNETTGKQLIKDISLASNQGSAVILKVQIQSADEIQVIGQDFGAMAGGVFVSFGRKNGDTAQYPLTVIDWESSRIKVAREFMRGSEKSKIGSSDVYEILVKTRDGRITAPFQVL